MTLNEGMGPRRPEFAGDLLRGAAAIAEFLFGNVNDRRKVYHLTETSNMPHFRIGSMLCARRSSLLHWFDDQEKRNSNGSTGPKKPRPDKT